MDDGPGLVSLAEDVGTSAYFNWATLTIAVVGLAVAVFAALYARRALFPPRRRLDVTFNSVAEILSPPNEKLTVLYEGKSVESPYACTLLVSSTGLHSISSAQFDKGEPIVIELGVPIVATLDIQSTPAEIRAPTLVMSGTAISISPSLLAPGQIVKVSILTDGKPDAKVRHRLTDTTVELTVDRRRDAERERVFANRTFLGVLLINALVVVAGTIFVKFSYQLPPAIDRMSFTATPADFFIYYPRSGEMVDEGPLWFEGDPPLSECDNAIWYYWADRTGSSPVNNKIKLTLWPAEVDEPVAIQSITPLVHGSFPVAGSDRVRCSKLTPTGLTERDFVVN